MVIRNVPPEIESQTALTGLSTKRGILNTSHWQCVSDGNKNSCGGIEFAKALTHVQSWKRVARTFICVCVCVQNISSLSLFINVSLIIHFLPVCVPVCLSNARFVTQAKTEREMFHSFYCTFTHVTDVFCSGLLKILLKKRRRCRRNTKRKAVQHRKTFLLL